MHFGHNILIIIISKGSAKLVIVHVRFALALTPFSGYLVRIQQLELPVNALPRDPRIVRGIW